MVLIGGCVYRRRGGREAEREAGRQGGREGGARTCRAPTSTASMRGLVPSAAQMGVKAAVDMGGGVWGEGGY